MSENNKKNIVLFIDDEKICHTLVELIIPNFTSLKIVNAFNGKEALNLARRYSDEICLVLSDILLPDINGYKILETLRQDKHFADIPFIFQSGLMSQEELLRKDVKEKINILYKPYKQEDLLRAIRGALNIDIKTLDNNLV